MQTKKVESKCNVKFNYIQEQVIHRESSTQKQQNNNQQETQMFK